MRSLVEIDEPAFLKLLEIRIIAVTIVVGFVLTSLSVATSEAKLHPDVIVGLSYLGGFVSLPEALVIHSGVTLLLLSVYLLVDLSAIHCLAFRNLIWASRLYKFNIAFAIFPFVLGAANVFVLIAATVIPVSLSGLASAVLSNRELLVGGFLVALLLGALTPRIKIKPSPKHQ